MSILYLLSFFKKIESCIDRILFFYLNYFTTFAALALIYPTNFPDFVYNARYLFPFSCLYLVKAKAKLLREQYQQKQRDYQDLKEETLKVVRGTSRLNVDLLNNLIEETTVQMAELEGQIRTAEAELREVLSGAEQVRQEYAQLMDWAGLYDNCSFEAKKMIAAQFVKAVRVKRGYEVDIEFNVSFEEFQTLYLEPESEEDRRSRSATYLSLVEKSGQAG